MFGQTFQPGDLLVIGLLVLLEGVLSIDNALVLGLLAGRLPKVLQKRALTYGLIGALVFRVVAILLAGVLLKWTWPKLLGGVYLIYVVVKHFATKNSHPNRHRTHDLKGDAAASADYAAASSTHTRAFWNAVIAIELTDIAFAVDSILAAIGTVRGRDKLWIVIIGGMLGVVLMRFAAVVFVRLLDQFPRFEISAYLLVLVIGLKLTLDFFFPAIGFHHPDHPAFWIFWGAMIACLAFGFVPARPARKAVP